MGIKLLTKFVETHNFVLAQSLSDCSVLVDGSSLIHQLHNDGASANDAYGGNYSVLMDDILAVLKAFGECHIKPIVILDGSINLDRAKLPVKLERTQAHIDRAVNIFKQQYNDKMFPILSTDLFEITLQRQHIPVYKSTYEADKTIVQIAQDLQLPIVSDDSDFFLENLPHGVLSTRSLLKAITSSKAMPDGKAPKKLDCSIYKVNLLLALFHTKNIDLLPLAACLLDNDMSNVVRTLPTTSSQKSYRFREIEKVLKFVSSFDTLGALLAELKGCLSSWPAEQSKKIEAKLLDVYQQSKETVATKITASIDQYFITNFDTIFTHDLMIPKWLIRAHVEKAVSHRLLYIANVGLDILRPMVENIDLPSAYHTTFTLGEYIYGLLLNGRDITTVGRYYRDYISIKKEEINPRFVITSDDHPAEATALPTLEEIEAMDLDERKNIFFKILQLDSKIVDDFEEIFFKLIKGKCLGTLSTRDNTVFDWTMLALIALIYMCQHYKGDIPMVSLYAIYTAILLNGQSSRDVHRLLLLKGDDRANIDLQLKEFNRDIRLYRPSMGPSPSKLVHYFSAYQACFQGIGQLSVLLRLDELFAYTTVPFLLNGSFIYNLAIKLDLHKCPLTFLETDVLGKTFGPLPLFRSWLEIVLVHSRRKAMLPENLARSPTKVNPRRMADLAGEKVDKVPAEDGAKDLNDLAEEFQKLSTAACVGELVSLSKVLNP